MTHTSSTILDQEPQQLQPLAGGNNHNGGQHPPVTFSPQDNDSNRHRGEPTGPLARLERELARRASFPFSAAIAPGFIPAGMFVLEEDTEIADDWQNNGEPGNETDDEQEQDDSSPTTLVARPQLLAIHNVTQTRYVMYAACPADEPDPDRTARRLPLVDSGDWLTIRPSSPRQDDDEDGDQRPALDPRFPLPSMPSGAAILLALAQKQAQAQRGAFLLAGGKGSGQDWHPFDNIVFDDPNEEFVYPVIPVWEEEQDQLHTEANGYNCGDPTCDCATTKEAQ